MHGNIITVFNFLPICLSWFEMNCYYLKNHLNLCFAHQQSGGKRVICSWCAETKTAEIVSLLCATPTERIY
jgi:hypothetical protein